MASREQRSNREKKKPKAEQERQRRMRRQYHFCISAKPGTTGARPAWQEDLMRVRPVGCVRRCNSDR